jgi:hypothetical protein
MLYLDEMADLVRIAEIVPGVPWLKPGPDGRFGTSDDTSRSPIGDVDVVVRAGMSDFSGPFPKTSPLRGAVVPAALTEPFGEGQGIDFVVAASDGGIPAPSGTPVVSPSLDGAPILVVAFEDLDGDGFVGVTNRDGDPTDASLEEAELIPVGRQVAIMAAGRASGRIAVEAGGPGAAPARIALTAAAWAGTFRPDFFGGNVPDGPAIMTRLPFLPTTTPSMVLEGGAQGPGPARPDSLIGAQIKPQFVPDPSSPLYGEAFTLPTDGSEPSTDIAVARSGAFSAFGIARRPDPKTYRALQLRPLRIGLDAAGHPAACEIVRALFVPDDGVATSTALSVVPLDRLGNITDAPAGSAVDLRTQGTLRIVSPDLDGDPTRERVVVDSARGTDIVVDDAGAAFDGADADVLLVDGGGTATMVSIVLPDPDVDDSGRVDDRDATAVGARTGSQLGDDVYDARLDLDGDGRIDSRDHAIVSAHLGETITVP